MTNGRCRMQRAVAGGAEGKYKCCEAFACVPAATEVGGTAGTGARLGVTIRTLWPTAARPHRTISTWLKAQLVQTLIDEPIPHR